MRYSISTLLFLMLIFALYFPASALIRPLWIGLFENQFPEYCQFERHFEPLKALKRGDSEKEVLEKVPSLKKKGLGQTPDLWVQALGVSMQDEYGISADETTFFFEYDSEIYMRTKILILFCFSESQHSWSANYSSLFGSQLGWALAIMRLKSLTTRQMEK